MLIAPSIPSCQFTFCELIALTLGSHYENIPLVRIISRRAIIEFAKRHRAANQPLDDWYRIVKTADWHNLVEVQTTFPRADLVGNCVVFNVGGNKFRLIAKIAFRRQIVYVRFILTHKEYDKEAWKNDCKC